MSPDQLLDKLKSDPDTVRFEDVIETINTHYHYTPARFSNGLGADAVINEAGSNEGSCKIFALAQLQQLDKAATLACFGHYYRDEVLHHPDADNHANIRRFMRDGWEGIDFSTTALTPIDRSLSDLTV